MPRIYFYIARKFWGPFLFALGVFAALVVLGDTFEKLKTLNNGYSTLGAVLSYSLATFPNWLATIMPVACLLGAISVISEMVANGEWTACVAGGFSPKQLLPGKPKSLCRCLIIWYCRNRWPSDSLEMRKMPLGSRFGPPYGMICLLTS